MVFDDQNRKVFFVKMRKLFQATLLFITSIQLFSSNDWKWHGSYPWVYDFHSEQWEYWDVSDNKEVIVYKDRYEKWYKQTNGVWKRIAGQVDAKISLSDYKFKYMKWLEDPERYGGADILNKIKDAFDSSAKTLELEGKIYDLEPVSYLVDLDRLTLKLNNVFDLTPLFKLGDLEYLGLSGGHRNSDMSVLDKMDSLTEFTADYLSDIDLQVVGRMVTLDDLGIGNSYLEDISSLSKLTNLVQLRLNQNNISDITPLNKMRKLTHLNLSDNEISDMAQFNDAAYAKTLFNLNLSQNNRIFDITPLTNFETMERFDFRYNSLNNTQRQWIYSTFGSQRDLWKLP